MGFFHRERRNAHTQPETAREWATRFISTPDESSARVAAKKLEDLAGSEFREKIEWVRWGLGELERPGRICPLEPTEARADSIYQSGGSGASENRREENGGGTGLLNGGRSNRSTGGVFPEEESGETEGTSEPHEELTMEKLEANAKRLGVI